MREISCRTNLKWRTYSVLDQEKLVQSNVLFGNHYTYFSWSVHCTYAILALYGSKRSLTSANLRSEAYVEWSKCTSHIAYICALVAYNIFQYECINGTSLGERKMSYFQCFQSISWNSRQIFQHFWLPKLYHNEIFLMHVFRNHIFMVQNGNFCQTHSIFTRN